MPAGPRRCEAQRRPSIGMTFAAFLVAGANAPLNINQETTMKKFLAFTLGTALAGGMAVAQQPQDQSDYGDQMEQTTDELGNEMDQSTDEYGEEVGEWGESDPMQDHTDTTGQTETQHPMDDPTMQTEDPTTYGQGMSTGLADMSVEELEDMTLVTESGEELGQIERIGQSEQHQERVATVDVGGFLGVAEKTIAIPLSELELSADGNVVTSLTKESIESRESFDEEGFTEEGSDTTGY